MIRRMFRRAAHGKFVHVRFADDYGVLLVKFCHNRRIVRRHKVFQNFAARRGLKAFSANIVLYGDGNSRKIRQFLALGDFCVDEGCVFAGFAAHKRDECAQRILVFVNRRKKSIRQFLGGNFFFDKHIMQNVRRLFDYFHKNRSPKNLSVFVMPNAIVNDFNFCV